METEGFQQIKKQLNKLYRYIILMFHLVIELCLACWDHRLRWYNVSDKNLSSFTIRASASLNFNSDWKEKMAGFCRIFFISSENSTSNTDQILSSPINSSFKSTVPQTSKHERLRHWTSASAYLGGQEWFSYFGLIKIINKTNHILIFENKKFSEKSY